MKIFYFFFKSASIVHMSVTNSPKDTWAYMDSWFIGLNVEYLL